MRYRHRGNPRLVAYSDDRVVAVEGDRREQRLMIAVTVHALGRPGREVTARYSRRLFHRIYQLDLTKR